MTVVILIDRKGCVRCGRCYEDECPEILIEDEDGIPEVVELYRDLNPSRGKLPDELYDSALRGAECCSDGAIYVTKE
jgi:ferredoxin